MTYLARWDNVFFHRMRLFEKTWLSLLARIRRFPEAVDVVGEVQAHFRFRPNHCLGFEGGCVPGDFSQSLVLW